MSSHRGGTCPLLGKGSLDLPSEFTRGERLSDQPATGPVCGEPGRAGIPRKKHYWQMGIQSLDMAREFWTAHWVHDDIGQQQVDRRVIFEQAQRGISALGLQDRIIDIPQDRGSGREYSWIVVDNENDGFARLWLDRLLST